MVIQRSKQLKKKDVENQPTLSQRKNVDTKKSHFEHVGQENTTILSSISSTFIIISTTLVVFAAARNTITWHCQQFWGASADFWQSLWDRFLDTVGDDPYTLYVYGTLVLSLTVYWTIGILYTICDLINKPAAIMRYKVQPGMNEPVDTKRLLKVIGVTLFNQTVVTLPLLIMNYPSIQRRGFPSIRQLPTFHWVLFELAIFSIVREIVFYYSHRILHWKFLYKYIHKLHHEWTAPIAVTATYAHPIEHILSNNLPVFAGVFIMGSHIATAYLWYTIVIFLTLHHHSGYHLPFLPSPEFHDYHHLKFNQNFGIMGVLDRIHGTDAKFRNTTAFTRHVTMFNVVPPREMFPDSSKRKLGK